MSEAADAKRTRWKGGSCSDLAEAACGAPRLRPSGGRRGCLRWGARLWGGELQVETVRAAVWPLGTGGGLASWNWHVPLDIGVRSLPEGTVSWSVCVQL